MKLRKRSKRLLVILATGIVLLIYASMETRWVKTTHVTIESPDIPKSFDGKRIVFVSDIHHGAALSIERVQKLVRRINNLRPDIIILGGDYVSLDEKYIEPVFTELGKLKSKYGVFGVLGNHDYFVNGDLSKKMLVRNGIKLCDNKSYWVKINSDSIKIGGVDDPSGSKQILDSTIYDVHKSDFCILICHRPEYIDQIHSDLVDLTLSGHTHGGQVTFFGLWAPILPTDSGMWAGLSLTRESQKYRYGLVHSKTTMQSYITSGIGTRAPHFRFFCRPEIAVLELKRK
ncbi:MAG: metallophosphoesterase [Paludibacter sp.]|nr:metallophosphoesterase [Paludibacter sp.]